MNDFSKEFLGKRHELMAFIFGLVRDWHVAEDIFQEVWVRLAATRERGTAIEDQAQWCRKVAKNLVVDHWRRQRDARVVADSTLLEFADFVELAFEENPSTLTPDRLQALNDCVSVLPEKSRRLLSLRYEEDMSLAGVAETVGQSPAAVIKALLRLRQTLALCVQRKLRLEGLG
ncbi:MAG TPA: sigma-70 family RNA polymerase sigma factor [Clostridia bacterium]|nr:sigma-70 family RNA polymerase sigma factor [Clostridia bacterium]